MGPISPEVEKAIEQRLRSGPYQSVDELLMEALRALDDARGAAHDLLERELLLGLEGDEVEITKTDLSEIEHDAMRILEARKPR